MKDFLSLDRVLESFSDIYSEDPMDLSLLKHCTNYKVISVLSYVLNIFDCNV